MFIWIISLTCRSFSTIFLVLPKHTQAVEVIKNSFLVFFMSKVSPQIDEHEPKRAFVPEKVVVLTSEVHLV